MLLFLSHYLKETISIFWSLKMKIIIDDLMGDDIAAFLEEHIADMKSVSPPESKHALDLEGLRKSEIIFWTVWDDEKLIACGAIKHLNDFHAEMKSMRVIASLRGKGVASELMRHILEYAKNKGYKRLSLETGSMEFFLPARKLYEKFGFVYCGPFDSYIDDPNSVFMTLDLRGG